MSCQPLTVVRLKIVAGYIVLPMLGIIYWHGDMPKHEEMAINLALLVGALLGQVIFGILADRYGRKRLYGIALIIIMVATVFLALSARGEDDSIHIFPALVVWRFLLGVGIGGDFPLSAVITAESVAIQSSFLQPFSRHFRHYL